MQLCCNAPLHGRLVRFNENEKDCRARKQTDSPVISERACKRQRETARARLHCLFDVVNIVWSAEKIRGSVKLSRETACGGSPLCMCYKLDTLRSAEKNSRLRELNRETARARSALEQITGVEPASSVWETEVITAILYLHTHIIPHLHADCKCLCKSFSLPHTASDTLRR